MNDGELSQSLAAKFSADHHHLDKGMAEKMVRQYPVTADPAVCLDNIATF